MNSSIWLINKTLTGTTTPGQSEPEINGNEEILNIPQSSNQHILQPRPTGQWNMI